MACFTFQSTPSVTLVLGAIASTFLTGAAAPRGPALPEVAVRKTGASDSTSSEPTSNKSADAAIRAEAASRFDRALKLFDAGDNAGALAEFKRTYEILPDPMVRYNLGLVYAAMGRPVDAVDALQPLVERGELSPTHLERATQTLIDQKARIGRLLVTTKPEGARVEVDSVEMAQTPLSVPLRISEGKHVIGAVAEGYAPTRKELFIAGNSDVTMTLELIPTRSKQVATVNVRVRPMGVEVLVDGKSLGKTPLGASVTVQPGQHVVELRRPGYVAVRRELEMGEGGSGELAFDLSVDEALLEREGATLVLDPSESPIEVVVDGKRIGPYLAPLRLPPGPHHVRVVAAGFVPFERDVSLVGTQTNVLPVVLEPTPETHRNYRSSAQLYRVLDWVAIIGGAAVAGGSGVLAALGTSRRSDARQELDVLNGKFDQSQPPCDWREGYAAEDSQPARQTGSYVCDKLIHDARSDIDLANQQRLVGFIGVGVGSAIAVTGLVLLLTGPDPNKYDRNSLRSAERARRQQATILPGPGELGLGLRLDF